MYHPPAAFSLLLACALAIPWRSAEAATPDPRQAPPAATDARLRAQLLKSVEREVEAAGLGPALGAFKVSPALVQLRRYVHTEAKRVEWVCVVDLALLSDSQDVVASVRGSAATQQGAAPHALDAAVHAAVSRLPQALQALGEARKKAEKVARR